MANSINQRIIKCTDCSRLSAYLREVAQKKVRRFNHWNYWGKPVPGFGDEKAKVLIIGLAPAAHGANRTGRMFTGDSSGDWLYKALYETGFANQQESNDIDDGLVLKDTYITSIVKCAPPQNKPTSEETKMCAQHLHQELLFFKDVKVILCLGGLAFYQYCRIEGLKGLKFFHKAKYELEGGQILMASYHPSRQNTQTGRLKWVEWVSVFEEVKLLI
ncbi:MAG: uracil-DNA glycosylase [Flavobacteriales bacterium]|nr:MAG: uracil-DNA glycosylase [Flavobacteriales bacterium]